MSLKTTELDALFSLSSEAPFSLKDDHVKWHAFINDRGFHNHTSHHLVAIYAMGAGGPLTEEAYQSHVVSMQPAFKSPEPITDDNFWKHLGKREFYDSYLEYFRAVLLKKGPADVLEKYIFSPKANVGGPGIDAHPRMLNRLLAVLLHPMIHAGNGLEFGLLGLVAEGLAQAAVHRDDSPTLIPPELFQTDTIVNGTNKIGVHAFTILARVLSDQRFSSASLGLSAATVGPSTFERIAAQIGSAVVQLTNEWAAEFEGDGATEDAIAKKIEELSWMAALVYGVGGWAARERAPAKKFNADFFYMHLVTSSIFLPAFAAYLSPRSTILLLRGYFAVSLVYYIARGCAPLPIRAFYESVGASVIPPGTSTVAPVAGTLTLDDAAPNPWLLIVQTTLVHPDEHLCKTQRALMHDATLYGQRAAGDFAGLGLEGAEALDGTLFVRVAGLTADRLGWMKEGQEAGDWDRQGFIKVTFRLGGEAWP
ncbi:hypothetical protein L226DRAFT_574175 [Lentinus tigrinus ALCF2SS1-7]|uniref:DUF4243 domain-containing protein n=1 Tax=Lentinus tigrinus ALCF2SS1-6 TaxID=1328759 RepID=A0A5C2S0B5_9APHY|nr:hypothetical protein L227DRAFT_614197 [Lentinus tigrinus ALCF2SS1-6]RPD71170.1 hypothetical protein L226DRAFT_574175 [Lentinus tigrinus ALCF2SS1-7]